jgi:hypothetical protein
MKNIFSLRVMLWGLIATQAILFSLFSRLDPDTYHDGFIYGPAIAVADGLLPHRDVFAQYGPVSPIIQGVWLKLTSPTIFSLKILNGIFVLLICLVLVHVLKRRIKYELAQLFALAWLSWFAASMPWPSIITTLFTLTALSVLLNDGKIKNIEIHFSAFLLTLAIFTRIQSILFLVPLIPIYIIEKDVNRRKFFKRYLLSVLFFLTVGVLLLSAFGMMSGYWIQSIEWSSAAYSSVEISKSFISSFIWFPVSLLIFLLLLSLSEKMRVNRKAYFPFFLFLACMLTYIDHQELNGHVSLANFKVLIIYAARSFMHFTGYATATAVIVLLGYLIFSKALGRQFNFYSFLSVSWGVLALSQLWPLHDDIHVWFIAPLLLTATVFATPSEWNFYSKYYVTISLLICSSILANVTHNYSYMKQDRVSYQSFGLRGMYGSPEKVALVDATVMALEKASKSGPFRNLCTHGYYSVVKGEYGVTDGRFAGNSRVEYVDWYPTFSSNLGEPSFYFYCGLSYSEYLALPDFEKIIHAIGDKRVLAESSSINILYRGFLPKKFIHY